MKSPQTVSLEERIGHLLQSKRPFILLEITIVFLSAFMIIYILSPLVNDHPILQQSVVWLANVTALGLVWLGMRLRGEGLIDLGINLKFRGWKSLLGLIGKSLLVFIFAVASFMLGSIIMANITGIPEGPDMTGYNYLKGNVGWLILSLIGVYIVSSIGEEVIYRAFLITRINSLFKKRGKVIAIISSSIIFGLVHYEWGLIGIVQTFFMGLALSVSYIRFERNLWVTIIAHAIMDSILMVQLYLA